MNKRNSGFTLVEVVVVLAVVAILAAILTPNIVKNIKDSKIARAANETQVIAAALASFYKDVGSWPTSDGSSLSDSIRLLYGDGNAPDSSGTNAQYWRSNAGWSSAYKDTFAHHLVENAPKGASDTYPNENTVPKPELKWSGPYIIKVKADPWGNHYSCNIRYTFYSTQNGVGVLSAGPDRVFNTQVDQAMSTFTVGNDDLITRIK